MTRQRAWILAAITTVSLAALIVGIGATFGQFGFRGGREPADAASSVTQGAPADGQFFLSGDGNTFQQAEEEHERWEEHEEDEEGEHERERAEHERREDGYEREEHEDDD